MLAALLAFAATLASLGHSSEVLPVSTTRIMPLGDSITRGRQGGYRKKLRQSLASLGYNVDFVGNEHTQSCSLPDPDHEGHSGWTIRMIRNHIEDLLHRIVDPDVILLHIGTNDFGKHDDIDNAIHRFDELISKIASLQPYTHIIATNLLIRGEPYNSQIEELFNPFVQDIVANHTSLGERVTFLDIRSHVPLDKMPDNLHPNEEGYDLMADAWATAIQNVTGPNGDGYPPGLLRAQGSFNRNHVTITFSKPIADEVINVTNFSIDNGVSIVDASLDKGKREIDIVTSEQLPETLFTVTVNGGFDRTSEQNQLSPNSNVTFLSRGQGYNHNIPEEKCNEYLLAYTLDIPTNASYSTFTPDYKVDNHEILPPFSRIAYYLELLSLKGDFQYIWVSMEAFTNDAKKIAVPTKASDAVFQREISGLNIVSNVESVGSWEGLDGNIEFWPTNYASTNAMNVPGATESTYDSGDTRRSSGNYGSMQVHRSKPAQTLFAFNRWGSGGDRGAVDIGIGNSLSSRHDDWTFEENGDQYEVKTLQVLVQPSICLPAALRPHCEKIPEAARYSLAYSLDVPTNATYWASTPDYNVNNNASLSPFSRIAYFLELQTLGGVFQYIWVSMDAFTCDAEKIAVPTRASGAVFQREITGLKIVSNVDNIGSWEGLDGNIEFWPTNYGSTNAMNVTGARDSTYDSGDARRIFGDYGSMQIHRAKPAQTLFAFNGWGRDGDDGAIDIGIGNSLSSGHDDWTFEQNGDQYVTKKLQVYVRN